MPSPRASAGSSRNRPAARSFSPRPADVLCRRKILDISRVVEARVPAAGFTQLRCNSSDAEAGHRRGTGSGDRRGLGLRARRRLSRGAPEARFAANFVKLVIHPGFGITATLRGWWVCKELR